MSLKNNIAALSENTRGNVSDEDDFQGFEESFAGFDLDQIRQPLHAEKKLKTNDGQAKAAITRKHNPTKNKDIRKNYNDPAFRKPFSFNWKRELVIRATVNEKNHKERGDVYYITPSGKRVRTKQEITNHLHESPELTLENFTFSKETVGGTQEEEIVRHAKPNPNAVKRTPDILIQTQAQAQGVFQEMGKRIPKKKLPKGASPEPPSLPKQQPIKIPIAKESPKSQNGIDSKINKTTGKIKTPTVSRDILSTKFLDKVVITKNDQQPISPTTLSPQSSKGKKSVVYCSSAFSSNFFNNVSMGYDVLLHIFQYLKVQELLRCGCVCRMWSQAANHFILWKTVRMKNSLVTNWSGLASTLQHNNSRHLDLKKMLIASDANEMWRNFSNNIGTVVNLKSIDFCRCPAWVIENLFTSNLSLEALNAVTINSNELNLSHIGNMRELKELRLRSTDCITLQSTLEPLSGLSNLRHISLTSIIGLGSSIDVSVIAEILDLETLELGECSDLTQSFATETLSKLVKLEKLRLEKCQQNCPTNELLDTIAILPKLTQLELINFDISTEFEQKIAKCTNLRRLLLIPTYIQQSATTNLVLLTGIQQLSATLVSFIWVITTELLKVTDLYIEEGRKVKSESIPVLKPLPFKIEGAEFEYTASSIDIPNEIEIVPLLTIEKMLAYVMPETKVKILKVPLSSTWKQCMADF